MIQDKRDEETDMAELIRDYSDMVLRLALAYMKNWADAQDIYQEVFLKLFRQKERFTDKEREKAWIIRVTINTCKDALRNPWRKRRAPLAECDLPIEDKEVREMVEMVLTLPRKYRAVIHLHYFENYRTAEIAGLLGRNENTIRTWLRRARELLKEQLEGEGWRG